MAVKRAHAIGSATADAGAVRAVLAHEGIIAPHTGAPFTEPLLFGIGGGVSVLYFVFEYKGIPPHVYVGTRIASPTDDPIDDLCSRLSVPLAAKTFSSGARATAALKELLAGGRAAVVWADVLSLPYAGLEPNRFAPYMQPMAVIGIEGDSALVADRSLTAHRVPLAALEAARGQQSSLKCKALIPTGEKKLADLGNAVTAGIKACAGVMLSGPEKGPKANFGLAALEKWERMVLDDRDPKGWGKLLPTPKALVATLSTIHRSIAFGPTGPAAGRALYAEFLEEASGILKRTALRGVAIKFQRSATAWSVLAEAMLPAGVHALAAIGRAQREIAEKFRRGGANVGSELRALRAREAEKRVVAEAQLSSQRMADLRRQIALGIGGVRDAERTAFEALDAAMR
jgi:hypothetical protein